MVTTAPHELCVKLNNLRSNQDRCALCQGVTESEVGPELFLEGTWSRVCDSCGHTRAPELANISQAGVRASHELDHG